MNEVNIVYKELPSLKLGSRKFISVDPSKCTGCGICEYTCSQEKEGTTWNPISSRIRVVRMKSFFNFSIACRACEEAECIKACPAKALTQCESTGILMVSEKKCKGCDWCVQACPHGGISINPDTGKAMACDLCGGEPQCIEFCPEEALSMVTTDEEADTQFNNALEKLPAEIEKLTETIKKRDWKPLLAEAENRSMKVTEKLEMLNRKAQFKSRI